jgi:hypothetical protein
MVMLARQDPAGHFLYRDHVEYFRVEHRPADEDPDGPAPVDDGASRHEPEETDSDQRYSKDPEYPVLERQVAGLKLGFDPWPVEQKESASDAKKRGRRENEDIGFRIQDTKPG